MVGIICTPLVGIGLRWLPKLGVDTSPRPDAHSHACMSLYLISPEVAQVQIHITDFLLFRDLQKSLRERPLLMSNIRVGRGSKIAPKMGCYRGGQGR